jgi:hypothetical protein
MAAEHLYELALDREPLLAYAVELEGHPDNVAAALYGGFVICSRDGDVPRASRLDPPEGRRPTTARHADQRNKTNSFSDPSPHSPGEEATVRVAADGVVPQPLLDLGRPGLVTGTDVQNGIVGALGEGSGHRAPRWTGRPRGLGGPAAGNKDLPCPSPAHTSSALGQNSAVAVRGRRECRVASDTAFQM